jgi:ketosteroid isomerase-like protein
MQDTEAIEALTARWARAYAGVHIEEAVACFAPGGIYMVPGKAPFVGRDGLLEIHRFWLRNGGPEFSYETVGAGAGIDHGWHAVVWRGIYPTLEPGKTILFSGKLMHAFARDIAGDWRIQAGILNLDPTA